MAIIKKKELRKMDSAELGKRLGEIRMDLAKDKSNMAIGAMVASPGMVKEKRKTIARILTLKREKTNE